MTTWHETFAAALADPRALSPVADARGFAVHRNNRAYGLVEAMRAQFPAVARLMGRDVFADAALAFIRQHPPRSPVMARIGATFADFIESAGIAQAYGFLPDVARLEYAMAIALHAADDAVVRIEAPSQRATLNGVPKTHSSRDPDSMCRWASCHRVALRLSGRCRMDCPSATPL
jgi:hypothetical protein